MASAASAPCSGDWTLSETAVTVPADAVTPRPRSTALLFQENYVRMLDAYSVMLIPPLVSEHVASVG